MKSNRCPRLSPALLYFSESSATTIVGVRQILLSRKVLTLSPELLPEKYSIHANESITTASCPASRRPAGLMDILSDFFVFFLGEPYTSLPVHSEHGFGKPEALIH